VFLPIGDSPNPRFTPYVTWGLIAINVAVFLALLPMMSRPVELADPAVTEYLQIVLRGHEVSQPELAQLVGSMSAYDLFVFEHGSRPDALSASDVLFAMFLHGGWLHLLGNMLFLWIYGDNVEHHLGRGRFAAFYLGTGIVATLGDALLRSGSGIPSVGASGAISGVLGAYFLWFPFNRVRVMVVLFPFFMDVVEISARWVLGAYVLLSNVLPMLLGGGGSVSHGAHLAGFGAGLAAAWTAGRLALVRGTPEVRSRARGAEHETATQLTALRRALAEERAIDAAAFFLALPRKVAREQVTATEKRILALQLERADQPKAAAQVYQQIASHHRRTSEALDAELGLARIYLESFGMPAEAYAILRRLDSMNLDGDQRAEESRLVEILNRVARNVPHTGWH